VTVVERRARLGLHHRLTPQARAEGAAEVAESLVALHATDPSTVYLAAMARLRVPAIGAVELALYKRRELVRMLGMRRTMFVVPRALAPVVQAAATDAVAMRLRRRYEQIFAEAGVDADTGRWLRDVGRSVVALLASGGEATAAELAQAEPRLRTRIGLADGKTYSATVNVTSMVLNLVAAEGLIVRGRPLGSWISSQYRWAAWETWFPGPASTWSAEAARIELARRWLAAFGPAGEADLRWWTGWTARDTRQAIAGVPALAVDLDGVPGLLLEEDMDPPEDPEPWIALLPALDPTAMGWTERDWYLGPHRAALFDNSGNIGPSVWADGRIIGGWAQRRDGSLAVRLLEDAGAEVARGVEEAAYKLGEMIAPALVTPRFRTPLERELSST
jgi:hypothetical protein